MEFTPNALVKKSLLVVCIICSTHHFSTTPAKAQIPNLEWNHVFPYPTADWLYVSAWGPSGYVAAGTENGIIFSEDAQQWERAHVPGPGWNSYHGAAYHEGTYVLVGSQQRILTSQNGRDWMVTHEGANQLLQACTAGAGLWVATGRDGIMLVSTNALDWEEQPGPGRVVDMAFGNGLWVALSGGSLIHTSTNLRDWTSVDIGNFGQPALAKICFGQGRFVAGGAWLPDQGDAVRYGTVLMTSTNGLDWEWSNLNGLDAWGETRALGFANGSFIALHNDFLLKSTDGASWQHLEAPPANGELNGLALKPNGSMVVVGEYGTILRSEEGLNWNAVGIHPAAAWRDVAQAEGKFLVVGGIPYSIGGYSGSSAALFSTNGMDWQISLTNLEEEVSAVAYGKSRWVVTGEHGGIFTSLDGVNWMDRRSSSIMGSLHEVCFGGGQFVAYRRFRDEAYVSSDGLQWRKVESRGASAIYKVVFLNGRFFGMASDNDGFFFHSADGISWQKLVLPGTEWVGDVAFGKKRYVAVGRQFSAISFDRRTWQVYPIPQTIGRVEYIDGWFIGWGSSRFFSRDGITWQSSENESPSVTQMSYDPASDSIVSISGFSVYRATWRDVTGLKSRVRLLPPSQIEYFGADRMEYQLQRSFDLKAWKSSSTWIVGHDDFLIWNIGPFDSTSAYWRISGRPR